MKWMRPSGIPLETNDLKETIEYGKSLGWKPMDAEPEQPVMPDEWHEAASEAPAPRRGRRRNA